MKFINIISEMAEAGIARVTEQTAYFVRLMAMIYRQVAQRTSEFTMLFSAANGATATLLLEESVVFSAAYAVCVLPLSLFLFSSSLVEVWRLLSLVIPLAVIGLGAFFANPRTKRLLQLRKMKLIRPFGEVTLTAGDGLLSHSV